MRDRLTRILPVVDQAVASCDGVASPDSIEEAKAAVAAVRTRLSYPEEAMVVALAGGTGSGKSSLLNAVTGSELADSGGVRPTTSRPFAAVPSSAAGAFDRYLDVLGITEWGTHDGGPFLWLDLPDVDSVEVDHRLHAERLLPVVDAIVWVLDPEKYRDAGTHHDYIRPLSEYHEQLVFVLNQTDRLEAADIHVLTEDLKSALEEDGIREPRPIPIAASPPAGPPIGIGDLLEVLEAKRADPAAIFRKLAVDLERAILDLAAGLGESIDFDAKAQRAVARAVEALGRDERAAAVGVFEALYSDAAESLPAPLVERVAVLASQLPIHVERVAAETWTPGRRRLLRAPEPGVLDDASARSLLSESIVRPLRAHLARRAMASASAAEAMLAIGSLRGPG